MQFKKQFTTTSEEYLKSQGYTYFAFISYKREDEKWAKWLKKKLQSYRLPTKTCETHKELPQKISPVFLDKDNMTPGHLANQEKSEVQSAKYIIVICSKCARRDSKNLDDEIRFFIEGGADPNRIIPFIVDESDDPVENCFPLYLQELCKEPSTNIIGANIFDSGKRNAFLKVVAYMLGIKLVELESEENRRRKKKLIIKALLAVVLLIMAIIFWDYAIPKKSYYLDYTTKRGEPVGICELSKKEIKSISEHYVIVEQFGKIKELMLNDSYGNIVDTNLSVRKNRPIHVKYKYAKHKELKELTYYNNVGTPIRVLEYVGSNRKAIDIKSAMPDNDDSYGNNTSLESHTIGYLFDNSNKKETSKKSNVSRYLIDYDDKGFVQEVRYARNDDNEVGTDSDGISGIRYERDGLGRIKKEYYLKYKGKSGFADNSDDFECSGDKSELAIVEYKYDNDSFDCTEVRFFNADSEPTQNYEFVCSYKDQYKNHNIIKSSSFDENEQPVLSDENYSSTVMEYYYNGLVKKYKLFGKDGEPVFCKDGYSVAEYKYNSKGLLSEIYYYDTEANPTINDAWYASIRKKFDKQGNVIELSYFDINGNLTNCSLGYSTQKDKYDDKNNVILEEYFDKNGERTMLESGYSYAEFEYDSNSNITSARCYNPYEQPCLCNEGFFESKTEYKNNGRTRIYTYYGTDKNPIALEYGYSKIVGGYDKNGNWTSAKYYDADNAVTEINLGYAYWENVYDERGNKTETYYYGIDNEYAEIDGYCAYCKQKYDTKNNVTEVSYYNKKGKLALSAYGYAINKTTYDKRNNIIKEEFFDEKGDPIKLKDGYAAYECEYDERGNCLKVTYLNTEGELCDTEYGYAAIERTYNERDATYIEYFVNKNNELVMGKEKGYAVLQYSYNSLGQITEKKYYNQYLNEIDSPEE